MLVSLTVGKVDAGVAVLLTEDKRLIEFPSILLPADISTGSIVDVKVSRNHDAEVEASRSFDDLQSSILSTFGSQFPQHPVLRCRNATQTSVVLEWDPISLATAKLKSLSLYRNDAKAGVIPRPLEMTSTKISGLAVETEYTFQLVLRTSAGVYSSEKLVVKTHSMTDLTGITITPGLMAPELRDSLARTVEKVGAKLIEQVRIDTTHFVCTDGRGAAFEKAREMNIPVVLPDWIKGCEREGRLVGVRAYYLDANPKDRQIELTRTPTSESRPQRLQTDVPERSRESQPQTPSVIPPTPEKSTKVQEDDDANKENEPPESDTDNDPTAQDSVRVNGIAADVVQPQVTAEEADDSEDEPRNDNPDEDEEEDEDESTHVPNGNSAKVSSDIGDDSDASVEENSAHSTQNGQNDVVTL